MYPPSKAFNLKHLEFITKCLPQKKAPGFDLITLPLPPSKVTYFNSVLRTTYFPTSCKFAVILVIPKPQKPPDLPSSYRPISLLPVM